MNRLGALGTLTCVWCGTQVGGQDEVLAERRLALIRFLWNQNTIPSWAPASIETLATLPSSGGPPPIPSMGPLSPNQYNLSGAWATANLHHYERWAMRPAPDVHGLGYFGGAGSWGYVPFNPVGGMDPHVSEPQAYVPVFYFAPTVPTTKFFIIHDGHSPYGQPGHRNLAKWALDHGFGVAVIIMPWFGHGLEDGWVLWPPNYGDSLRIYLEATTNTVTHAQTLGYTTFVMEGISGGGWTTDFVAAMDTRIIVSYHIAGSLPHQLRTLPIDIGDFEQLAVHPVYRIVTFEDLYAMSASNGRYATQIFNQFDNGAVPSNGREDVILEYAVAADARASGRFQVWFDQGQVSHDVSTWQIGMIETDLRELGLIP